MTRQHRTGVEGVEHFTLVPPQSGCQTPLQDCWCMEPCCWNGTLCTCPDCYCGSLELLREWEEET